MIEKNTIKSQDSLIDCNNGKRSSETLIETISKLETTLEELERTKKQNLLLKIANAELREDLDIIKKQQTIDKHK